MGNPVYDEIPVRSVTHRDSVGAPSVQPTRAGVIDIDDLGRMYAAAGQVHRTITPPTGATEPIPNSELGPQHVDNVSGFADLADRGGLGGWFAQSSPFNFIQIQGLGPPLNIDLVATWHDVYTWIVANVPGGDTAAFNRFWRDDSDHPGAVRQLRMTPCWSCSSSSVGQRSRTRLRTRTCTSTRRTAGRDRTSAASRSTTPANS